MKKSCPNTKKHNWNKDGKTVFQEEQVSHMFGDMWEYE